MDYKDAVQLAKNGSDDGYNFLYQQTYQKSYYVALKYMKQEDLALDVLQDAYIKAFQNLDQLTDASKFPAWFARVVATKALDELRKKKVILFSQLGNDDDEFGVEDNFQDDRIDTQPELSLDKAETSRLVQEMIDTLSDEQRLCIMMFYVEEMSVKDIAKVLGVSENTVKSRLNYGRKNIKEKVLDLEKKGTKLYSLAPIPFFLWLLLQDSQNVQAATLPDAHVTRNVSDKIGKKLRVSTGNIAKAAGISASTKIMLGVIAAVVVGAGIVKTVIDYRHLPEAVVAIAPEVSTEVAAVAATEAKVTTETEVPAEAEVPTETEVPTEAAVPTEAEAPTEPEVVNNDLLSYASVLSAYYDNIVNGTFPETGGSVYFTCDSLDTFGYCFMDINNDGINELMLSSVAAEQAMNFMEMYTLVDGQPVSIAKTTGWYWSHLCEGGVIAIDESTLSTTYYTLENGQLVEHETSEFGQELYPLYVPEYTPFSQYELQFTPRPASLAFCAKRRK